MGGYGTPRTTWGLGDEQEVLQAVSKCLVAACGCLASIGTRCRDLRRRSRGFARGAFGAVLDTGRGGGQSFPLRLSSRVGDCVVFGVRNAMAIVSVFVFVIEIVLTHHGL